MSSWWEEQCPERGPALHHAHSNRCATEHGGAHRANQCCHCGQRPPVRITPPEDDPTTEPKMAEKKDIDAVGALSKSEAAHIGFLAWRAKRGDFD